MGVPTAGPSPISSLQLGGVSVTLPTDWTPQLIAVGSAVFSTLVILVAAALAIRLAHVFVRGATRAFFIREDLADGHELSAEELKKRQDTIEALAVNVVRFFVVLIAALMILEAAFKLDIGPAVAGLGIAGIAVGLGTQHLVRDYLNGALILMENQYARGYVVSVGGVSGVVEDFTLRRTTLRDDDGTLHTVPNGQITVASNRTRAWGQINEEIRIGYGTDLDEATALIDSVGRELADDPTWSSQIIEMPHVERIDRLENDALTLLVTARVRAASRWSVAGELRKRILTAFAARGVEFPAGVARAQPDRGAMNEE